RLRPLECHPRLDGWTGRPLPGKRAPPPRGRVPARSAEELLGRPRGRVRDQPRRRVGARNLRPSDRGLLREPPNLAAGDGGPADLGPDDRAIPVVAPGG